jgi:hypothetical protein
MNRFESRREKAQELMATQDVVALQVTSRENYFFLTEDRQNDAIQVMAEGAKSLTHV